MNFCYFFRWLLRASRCAADVEPLKMRNKIWRYYDRYYDDYYYRNNNNQYGGYGREDPYYRDQSYYRDRNNWYYQPDYNRYPAAYDRWNELFMSHNDSLLNLSICVHFSEATIAMTIDILDVRINITTTDTPVATTTTMLDIVETVKREDLSLISSFFGFFLLWGHLKLKHIHFHTADRLRQSKSFVLRDDAKSIPW